MTVSLAGVELKEGVDYELSFSNNINAGNATVTATGKGGYAGSKSATFQIAKAKQAVTASNKSVALGSTVSLGAKASGGGKLTYKSSNTAVAKVSAKGVVTPVKVGSAKVTITAAGTANYLQATKTVTVKVTALSLSKATVGKIADQKYDGTAKKPTPTVKVGGRTLKKGTDYTLTYKNNVKAGTATLTIKGKGKYSGSKPVTFKIVAMPGTWKKSGSRWWYEWKDGGYPANVFLDIDGSTYRFDASGWMLTGWQQVGGKWYYFGSSGAMMKSKWVGNYWMGADGVMATNAWVDGGRYYVGSDGAWVKGKTR